MARRIEAGEVWVVNLGMTAKTRPCLALSGTPNDDELALILIVPFTTAIRDNRWEISVEARFLNRRSVLHLQQIQPVPLASFERKVGRLSTADFAAVKKEIISVLDLGAT